MKMDNVVKRIGDEFVLTIPKEFIQAMNWEEGDTICASFVGETIHLQRAWNGTLDPKKINKKTLGTYTRHPF